MSTATLERPDTMPSPRPGDRPEPAPWVNSLELAALASAVAAARRFARDTLNGWGLVERGELAATTELVVSELVTNAVKATGSADPETRWSDLFEQPLNLVVVRLVLAPAGLFVEVGDVSAAAPVRRHAGPQEVGGRGLALVEALSVGWGYFPSGPGKVVWCQLAVAPRPTPQPEGGWWR